MVETMTRPASSELVASVLTVRPSRSTVMRSEIALPLQHMLKLYTVGCFLKAWRNPKNHKSIEQVFDSPEQASPAASRRLR